MHTSKLVSVLKTFTRKEWKAINNLIKSPWFCANADAPLLLQLVAVIQNAGPQFTERQLRKSRIVKKLFSSENKQNHKRLANLMSKLMRLIEHYVVLEKNTPTESQRQLLLAQSWQERGLEKLSIQTLGKAERLLQPDSAELNKAFYLQQLDLLDNLAHLHRSQATQFISYLDESEAYLDEWYLLTKLENAVSRQSMGIQQQVSTSRTLFQLEALIQLKVDEALNELPVHQLYYQALLLLRSYEEAELSTFERVEQQLQTHGHRIAPAKQKFLHTILRIFAIGHYNSGEQEYLSISFRLYQQHLKAGYLYFNDKIPPKTLLNIVALGLRMKELHWVDQFLEKHRYKILDQTPDEQVYRFNKALCLFHFRSFNEVLDFLDTQYEDLYYRLASRRLEIMIYYELDSPLFVPKLEAFKVYIFRLSKHQLPAKHKAINNNFIDLLRQVIHPSSLQNDKRIQLLKEKVNTSNHLAERDWLLKILDRLQSK